MWPWVIALTALNKLSLHLELPVQHLGHYPELAEQADKMLAEQPQGHLVVEEEDGFMKTQLGTMRIRFKRAAFCGLQFGIGDLAFTSAKLHNTGTDE
nr:hypothetical protein BaRGS_025865 [Batillaria attramentaria]